MQDLTQIHSRMHPLVSKESDLQRKNHSRDVGNGHKKRKAETISSRGAQTGFQESSPTTKAFSNFAEGQRRSTTSSFPIPFFTKNKIPEQTNQRLRSPSATIPTTKNRNSVTNERMTNNNNRNKQQKRRRTKSQAISATKKKTSNELAYSRVQTSQYCDNDDCRKGAKPKKKEETKPQKQGELENVEIAWQTAQHDNTVAGRKEPMQCSLSYSLVTTKTYALYVRDDVSVSFPVHRIRTNPLVLITRPGT